MTENGHVPLHGRRALWYFRVNDIGLRFGLKYSRLTSAAPPKSEGIERKRLANVDNCRSWVVGVNGGLFYDCLFCVYLNFSIMSFLKY